MNDHKHISYSTKDYLKYDIITNKSLLLAKISKFFGGPLNLMSTIVKAYVNVLSLFTSYYVTAASLDKIHLRMRLSTGFPGKPSSVESSKI